MKHITLIAFLLFTIISCKEEIEVNYITYDGFIHGTTYHIVFSENDSTISKDKIENLMHEIDKSWSTFLPSSIVSRVNNNDTTVILNNHFINVFNIAKEITKKTNGAFDITVAPLVNAWGFGFRNKEDINCLLIDSLIQFVGSDKVKIIDNKIVKENPNVQIDGSAIAKGYSVDNVCNFFNSEGITNYLVEIGGEVRAKGKKNNNDFWKVGIDKPIDNITPESRELQDIIMLKNKALATSGNYRQFYIKNGIKYSHTINPKTGYPVNHKLLSVSILADDCTTADAYATAFMVLGLEKSKKIVETSPELEAYFIYSDNNGEFISLYTEGIKDLIMNDIQ
ncbi:MAG: FAD:protein FMN transferase [Bacteroidales bacterium]|nr:FAD:protein FMN transferase [Bacteroidales bacterium]